MKCMSIICVYIFDAPFKYWAREIVWKIASNADAFFAFTNCVYVKAHHISIDKFKAFYIFKYFFSNNGTKFRSISTEVQEADLFIISSVKFPVPGPISTKMSFFRFLLNQLIHLVKLDLL